MVKNKEEKVAEKIAELLNDLTLDLEMVGMFLAHLASSVTYNRFIQVFESARYHREKMYEKEKV